MPSSTTAPDEPSELDLIVLPGATGQLPPDVTVGCRAGPTFPAASLASVTPIEAPGYEFVVDAIDPFLGGEEGQFWPQSGWQVLYESSDEVLIVHLVNGERSRDAVASFMTVERRGEGWVWGGSSAGTNCRLTTSIPAGLNRVEWRLDPNVAVGPDSTVIDVLARELECASGQPMGGRLLDPDVVITDEAVYIAFAALPDGQEDHNCQGNPEVRVAVELSEPLGDRKIRNGLTVAGFLGDYIGDAFR